MQLVWKDVWVSPSSVQDTYSKISCKSSTLISKDLFMRLLQRAHTEQMAWTKYYLDYLWQKQGKRERLQKLYMWHMHDGEK